MDMFDVIALTAACTSAALFCKAAVSVLRGGRPDQPTQIAIALSLTASFAVSGVGALARSAEDTTIEGAADTIDKASSSTPPKVQPVSRPTDPEALAVASVDEPYSGRLRGVERYLSGHGGKKRKHRSRRRRRRNKKSMARGNR